MLPFGAWAYTGRNTPSFCGTPAPSAVSSSSRARTAKFTAGSTLPSNGQLKPVAVCGVEPVRSTQMSLPRTSTFVAIFSGLPKCLPSSSSQASGAGYSPSGSSSMRARIRRSA